MIQQNENHTEKKTKILLYQQELIAVNKTSAYFSVLKQTVGIDFTECRSICGLDAYVFKRRCPHLRHVSAAIPSVVKIANGICQP